ncbi:hypothetical protein FACS189490_12380 [Clostridia bacterium]|nr:hypothetical protein FACS189490_12380 [Clostridia bacterium]
MKKKFIVAVLVLATMFLFSVSAYADIQPPPDDPGPIIFGAPWPTPSPN